MAKNEPILEVENFNVEFWVDGVWYPAAINMNFTVSPGEVLAIVGESGSGKSTTAMGLMGLLADNARTSGSVRVKGVEMLNQPASVLRKFRGKEVAYIFQEPMTALNPVMSCGDQLDELLRSHTDLNPTERREKVQAMMARVKLPDPPRMARTNSMADGSIKCPGPASTCRDNSFSTAAMRATTLFVDAGNTRNPSAFRISKHDRSSVCAR